MTFLNLAGLEAAQGLHGRATAGACERVGPLVRRCARARVGATASHRCPTLILVGGYAGWAGSLPAPEVERRLAFALDAADRIPGGVEPASVPGLFSEKMSSEATTRLTTIMSEIRPTATRTMAYALAEADLRPALPSISVPTLLIYGDADKRSPLTVGEDLHRRIPASHLVVLPGLGHECYLEEPDRFNAEVREFLRR